VDRGAVRDPASRSYVVRIRTAPAPATNAVATGAAGWMATRVEVEEIHSGIATVLVGEAAHTLASAIEAAFGRPAAMASDGRA
jgi:hypothetical protein